MSPKLPRVTAADVVRALHRDGWRDVRQSGAHLVLEHPKKSGHAMVAIHARVAIKPKTLKRILAQAGLTVDEFRSLL